MRATAASTTNSPPSPRRNFAIQALINGQMDIAIGTPYSVIQKSKLPLKVIFQMSRLVFPVAANEYPDWASLDGEPFTFHARGTGTEAIGNIIAKREASSSASGHTRRAPKIASSP
ncbi:MAG: hypothetical protein R3D33_18700 [Hyphomicrobiaceae bacterium]